MSLTVPRTVDLIRALDSAALYELEQAGLLAREVLDDRIAAWVESDWTQQQIAEEIGVDQSNVSRRLARLGLTTSSKRGRPVNYAPRIIPGPSDDESAEEVDGEVVEEPSEVRTHPARRPTASTPARGAASGRRVRCPVCRHKFTIEEA